MKYTGQLALRRWALQRCIADESDAMDRWRKIIESAGDVYPETLKFGVLRVGFSWHWKEELAKLEEGLDGLRELPSEDKLDAETRHGSPSAHADQLRRRFRFSWSVRRSLSRAKI